MPDLSNEITEQAIEPIASATDGQSATGRAIPELVLADQYTTGKPSIKKRRRGIRFSKLIPSGPMSDGGRTSPLGEGGFV